MKSGNLNFLEPSEPRQASNGTALPLNICALYMFTLHDYITMHGATNITLERLTEYEETFYIKFNLISSNTFKWCAEIAQ